MTKKTTHEPGTLNSKKIEKKRAEILKKTGVKDPLDLEDSKIAGLYGRKPQVVINGGVDDENFDDFPEDIDGIKI